MSWMRILLFAQRGTGEHNLQWPRAQLTLQLDVTYSSKDGEDM